MVIINLDISNVFGTLYTRLVLDVLTDKSSHDYECVINLGVDFETTIHELKAYFGFFRLQRHVTCETIIRFKGASHTMGQQIMSGVEKVDFKEIAQNL